MSRYPVRFTLEALEDLKRLQASLIERDPAAARAVDAIETSLELLECSPFSCRKAWPGDRPLLRELTSGLAIASSRTSPRPVTR